MIKVKGPTSLASAKDVGEALVREGFLDNFVTHNPERGDELVADDEPRLFYLRNGEFLSIVGLQLNGSIDLHHLPILCDLLKANLQITGGRQVTVNEPPLPARQELLRSA